MTAPSRFSVKFALLHGMILVAGLAVCLSMRPRNQAYSMVINQAIEEWKSQHSILLLAKKGQGLFLDTPPYVAIVTLTVLMLRSCPPRPTFRRLARQPGFVACFAASFVIMMGIALDLLEVAAWGHLDAFTVRTGGQRPFFDLIRTITEAEQYPGHGVAVAWALLWLGGRRRPDSTSSSSSRLEGVGRALGYYWLAFIVLGKFFARGHFY